MTPGACATSSTFPLRSTTQPVASTIGVAAATLVVFETAVGCGEIVVLVEFAGFGLNLTK